MIGECALIRAKAIDGKKNEIIEAADCENLPWPAIVTKMDAQKRPVPKSSKNIANCIA